MQTETAEFRQVPITALVASKTNPRTHFDQAYILELSNSILDKGLIQPIVVRPNGKAGAYEIVAGECRYRASKLAALEQVPVIVRHYTDEQVLDVQLIENIHRTDLTPLEQAVGYRRLIAANPTKYSAETIASRIGMSVAWVWDRLKLNDLIPEAKAILEAERMTVGHAILIARLKPEDQQRAVEFDDDRSTQYRGVGLWRTDNGFDFDEDAPENKGKKPGKYDGLKACSVRELEAWIRNHVRFDVAHAAQAQPLTFETTAAEVEAAAAQPGRGKKVIAITHEYRVADDARDEGERTYGSQSWKRADGEAKSKTCDHSVLGVVVAGERQGSTLQVCIARDKCIVHFADVVRAKKKAEELRDQGKGKQAAKVEKKQQESSDAKWRREQAERDALSKAWAKLQPLIIADALDQVKTKPLTPAAVQVLGEADYWNIPDALQKHLGKNWFKTPTAYTWWVLLLTDGHFDSYDEYVRDIAKPAGLNIARLDAVRDKHQPPAAAAPAKKPGKAAKKR